MGNESRWLTTLKRVTALLLLLLILGPAVWTWGALKFVYASGERAGYVQKFSKRGWLSKTWEGEMALVTLPGTAPEIFYFTVRNDATAAKIVPFVGQRVALHYDQHKGIPGTWFGDTEYFVTRILPTTSQQLP
jgi:hypothetical protein